MKIGYSAAKALSLGGRGVGEGALRSRKATAAEHPHPELSLKGEGFR
jgi:hypothetical protein